jgi:hypothetical protein
LCQGSDWWLGNRRGRLLGRQRLECRIQINPGGRMPSGFRSLLGFGLCQGSDWWLGNRRERLLGRQRLECRIQINPGGRMPSGSRSLMEFGLRQGLVCRSTDCASARCHWSRRPSGCLRRRRLTQFDRHSVRGLCPGALRIGHRQPQDNRDPIDRRYPPAAGFALEHSPRRRLTDHAHSPVVGVADDDFDRGRLPGRRRVGRAGADARRQRRPHNHERQCQPPRQTIHTAIHRSSVTPRGFLMQRCRIPYGHLPL